MFQVNFVHEEGHEETLTADSVEELAQQLPEGYQGNITVYDESGFTRGWIHSRSDWRAQ